MPSSTRSAAARPPREGRYRLSPRARRDIEEIWDYSAERWGAAQAERYVRQLQAAVEAIAADPGLGRSCDDVRAGYRKYPAGEHILFYRPAADGIEVMRVLHRRMDFSHRL